MFTKCVKEGRTYTGTTKMGCIISPDFSYKQSFEVI